MNKTKSVRINDDLIRKVNDQIEHDESNFSTIINQSLTEKFAKRAWVPNLELHEYAGLTPGKLIENTQDVFYLRTSNSDIKFTLYPTSKDEWETNKAVYDYANGDQNGLHNGYVYFNLEFPVDLLLFLKTNSWETVEKMIISFLSVLYWLDENKQRFLQEQIEKKTLKEVMSNIRSKTFYELSKARDSKKSRKEFSEYFIRTLIDLGLPISLFSHFGLLLNSIDYPLDFSEHFPVNSNGLEIKIRSAYMRNLYDYEDDWGGIVIQGSTRGDDLHRSESQHEPWKMWLSEYAYHHNNLDAG